MSMKMEYLNKRKVSPEQLSILVEALSENKVLVHCKNRPSEAEKELAENLWEDLTKKLNSIGNGPSKTPSQWKKTLIDWKCNTKKKARELKEQQKTGGGTTVTRGLTANEKKLMSLSTGISVEGADAEEVGLGYETVDVIFEISDVVTEMPKDQQCSKRSKSCSPPVQRKKIYSDTETEKETDEASNLQNADMGFKTANKYMHESIEQILQTNCSEAMIELKKKELELKEVELKIRLLEATNKTKELELEEKKLNLEEAKFMYEQKTRTKE